MIRHGKKYKTKNGLDVEIKEILTENEKTPYKVKGCITEIHNNCSWTLEGKWVDFEKDHFYDLVEVKDETEKLLLSAEDIIKASSTGNVDDMLASLGFSVKKSKIKIDSWLNVYADGWMSSFKTKEEADVYKNRFACIHLIHGLEEGEELTILDGDL